MRYCSSCRAEIGAPFTHCPICQNELGEEKGDTGVFYPDDPSILKKSIFMKILIAVATLTSIVCVGLDYLFELYVNVHWGMLVTVWCVFFVLMLYAIVGKRARIAVIIGKAGILTAIAVAVMAAIIGFENAYVGIVTPIILLTVMSAEFIIGMIEKNSDALVFFLCCVLLSVAVAITMMISDDPVPFLWKVCILASVLMLVVISFFRWGRVHSEISKRLNI